jgi:hypothetical protein
MSRSLLRSVLLLALVVATPVACSSPESTGEVTEGPSRGGDGRVDAGPRRPVGGSDAGSGGDPLDVVDASELPDDVGSERDSGGEDGDLSGGDTGTAGDTGGPPPEPVGDPGGVTGVVWAPGNAPGSVPAGEEIPVSGALVYLTSAPPPPIPQQTYCAACVTPPGRSAMSDARGRFTLNGYPEGRWYLVIEKGQFRRQVEVEIEAGVMLPLDADVTTLPSRLEPSTGTFTPRIAVAMGASDHLEDILGKMDLGEVDASGRFIPMSSSGVFDVYSNGGTDGGIAIDSLANLVRDPVRLANYHILFIPCSGDANTSALRDVNVLRNLRQYVANGGNLYVTDWSGEWHDNVFPAQIQLGGDGGIFGFFSRIDTPASAWNAATETWNTSQFGDADGSSYDTPNGEVIDPDMREWLAAQSGPNAGGGRSTPYNATNFRIEGNWNFIEAVHDVVVGQTPDGRDIIDSPKVWVIGGSTSRPTPKRPMTVSYEPVGCGRVVYSTYHTTDDVHTGLVPQERVLLYLIMEIGTCRDPKQ